MKRAINLATQTRVTRHACFALQPSESERQRLSDERTLHQSSRPPNCELVPPPLSVDVPRFLRMLEWVTAEQRRLRLLMAEIRQIACRSTGSFLDHPRCIPTLNHAAEYQLMKRHELGKVLDRQTLSFSHLVHITAAAMGEEQDGDGEDDEGRAADHNHGCGKGVQLWA